MKATTFENRTKGINKNSNGYKNAYSLLCSGQKQYTCHTSGRGRFTTNIDSTDDATRTLIAAGLKENKDFVIENDSPRGGKTGNYIKLTSVGKRKMFK